MTLLFKPTLAYSKTPDLNDIVYPVYGSPKLDGIRCIMADGVAWTRSMKRIPNLFVQRELTKLQLHGPDGEIMLASGGDFNAVQSAIMSIQGEPDFCLNTFDDFTCYAGFKARYEYVERKISYLNSSRVKLVLHTLCKDATELQAFWDWCIAQGFEGAMVRSINGPYKRGRSTLKQGYLLKLKKWIDDEGIIIGFEEGQTNENEAFTGELGQTKRASNASGMVPSGTLGALLLSWRGKIIKVGTGFGLGVPGEDAKRRAEIWQNQKAFKGKTVSFKYQELTHLGMPRFPSFRGFRYE